jgi:hypothetical protein
MRGILERLFVAATLTVALAAPAWAGGLWFYRVTDWLSIGGGMSVVGGFFSSQSAINNPNPALGDGELKLRSLSLGHRRHVSYRSPVAPHGRFRV